MKPGILGLLLLSGCTYVSDDDVAREYALTWTCLSPEGCTRTERIELLDRAYIHDAIFDFESTRDEGFIERGELVVLDSLPPECVWVYSLALFTHELGPSKLCYIGKDFELTLSIPNRDLETRSMWRVDGRDLGPADPIRSPPAE
jgi:hypothetical protein